MSLISSPIAYPPSSSPQVPVHTEKRKLHIDAAYPSKRPSVQTAAGQAGHHGNAGDRFKTNALQELRNPPARLQKPRGPFQDDEEDEEEEEDSGPLSQDKHLWERRLKGGNVNLPDDEQYASLPVAAAQMAHRRARLPRPMTSSGKAMHLGHTSKTTPIAFESLIASRSVAEPGKATKSFYGIDIHALIDEAKAMTNNFATEAASRPTLPMSICRQDSGPVSKASRKRMNMLWTERYRARKFTELVGDDRTHRDVLRWIKHWDSIVFPHVKRAKPSAPVDDLMESEKPHRKILMLTGPPGLGKTTLAHVCARQAGYEVMEINASDERSSNVVKGRIKDCVGTENVKGVHTSSDQGSIRKSGRPVCVIVDEVDGVVSGSGGSGEGGFIKALIDLITLDQKNSNKTGPDMSTASRSKGKKDRFRLLRPVILICNDVYHPALRPLRTSGMAEVIHIRKPALDKVVTRLRTVFDKEGLACEPDGARRLCEATWGISSRKDGGSQGSGEGDIRGILVAAEWAAAKLRASSRGEPRLTKRWVEENMMSSLANGGNDARGIGRGGVKEAVDRVFQENAGFPKILLPNSDNNDGAADLVGKGGIAEAGRKVATDRLRQIIETSGESDRILGDCFGRYASHAFQDDTFLTKPNTACDWLLFHDRMSSRVHHSQDWELGPYLSHAILGFHHLFATARKQSGGDPNYNNNNDEFLDEPVPFTGPRAEYEASEAQKECKSILQSVQTSLSIPLMRSFRATEDIATDLVPHLMRMLTPDVKPVTVGGSGDFANTVSIRKESERKLVERAVGIMDAVGTNFDRVRLDTANRNGVSTFIYRMTPPIDTLSTFKTSTSSASNSTTRYAIRQAMHQEHQKYILRKQASARQARYLHGVDIDNDSGVLEHALADNPARPEEKPTSQPKRDFFGRVITSPTLSQTSSLPVETKISDPSSKGRKIWISFHEGFSNAVRKPITLAELMDGL